MSLISKDFEFTHERINNPSSERRDKDIIDEFRYLLVESRMNKELYEMKNELPKKFGRHPKKLWYTDLVPSSMFYIQRNNR